jgi:hypothetical protein
MKRFPSPCASAIQTVRPLESTPDTQPQLHPALLRFSAMISQFSFRLCLHRCLSLKKTTDDSKHHGGNDGYPGNGDHDNGSRICHHHRCPAFRLDRPALALSCGGVRRTGMKPFPNVIREFKKIDLRNSRFGFKHNPISFDTHDRGVLVFLALNGFEVLSQRQCRRQNCQNCERSRTLLHTGRILPLLRSTLQRQNDA